MEKKSKNTKDRFEERINQYLTSLAEKDPLFAERFGNPGKSIGECCKYIITTVKETGRTAFTDDEVYGMAVHYYQEDDPGKIDKSISCTVKMSGEDLSEDDKEKARNDAIREYKQSCVDRFRDNLDKTRRKPQPKSTEAEAMPSLF